MEHLTLLRSLLLGYSISWVFQTLLWLFTLLSCAALVDTIDWQKFYIIFMIVHLMEKILWMHTTVSAVKEKRVLSSLTFTCSKKSIIVVEIIIFSFFSLNLYAFTLNLLKCIFSHFPWIYTYFPLIMFAFLVINSINLEWGAIETHKILKDIKFLRFILKMLSFVGNIMCK